MEYFALQRTGVMDTQTRAPQSATQLAPICGARERVMGAQFTGLAFTGVLTKQSIAISMDGKGAWRDNVFVERLWHTIKYEEVYLRAYESVSDARVSIGRYQNKAVIYDLLFKASAETMLTIAADPKHLGARIGLTSVLHTWGSALTHHPHVHMIVPGGGISLDGSRWVSCRPGFFLRVRVLSRLFRRLFLKAITAAHAAGRLSFFGGYTSLSNMQSFATFLAQLRNTEWVVYSKRPFGGPEAVLAYLSRYTHRVAIANSRLVKFDQQGVTFKWKDYRIKGRDRYKVMTLATDEFIRRFLIHVLPRGFHRIRHYGLFAKNSCAITPHVPASCLPRRPQQRASRCRRQSQRTSLSVLQRSHDHHRGLGARRDASPSTNRSHDRGLDRHVVTAPKPLRKFVRLHRWSPAGRGSACSNVQLSSQSRMQQGHAFPTLISPIAVGGRAETSRPPSNKSTTALKSP